MSPKRGGLNKGLDAIIPKKNIRSTKKDGLEAKVSPGSNEKLLSEPRGSFTPGSRTDAVGNGGNDEGGERVQIIRISKVEPRRTQPRKFFDEDRIAELADSLKEHGVISPLLVQNVGDHYEIIAGERRWRAAQKAGLKEVPVIVKEYTPREVVEISLIENLQREDLNPMETAEAYDQLLREFELSQEQLSARVSKSRSAVANTLRLLRLPKEVRAMVACGSLSEGCARAILGLPSEEAMLSLAERAVKEKMTVREVEKAVQKLTKPVRQRSKSRDLLREAELAQLSERLKNQLGTRVTILEKGKNKGRIEIEYYSEEELERLLGLLSFAQE